MKSIDLLAADLQIARKKIGHCIKKYTINDDNDDAILRQVHFSILIIYIYTYIYIYLWLGLDPF